MRDLRALAPGLLLAIGVMPMAAHAQAVADSARHAAAHTAADARLRLLPVLTRAPETGFGLGAAIVRVTRPAGDAIRRPGTLDGVLSATEKGQAKLMLEDEVWSAGNRWRLYGSMAFDRSPNAFYGVLRGASAPVDPFAFYLTDTYNLYATVDRRIRTGLYFGVGIRSVTNHAAAPRPDTLVLGAPGVSSRGGRVTGLEQTLTWDTRDNIYAAHRGAYVLLQHYSAARLTGSEYRVEHLTLDARTYIPLRSEHVLALQVVHETLTGSVPYEQLPTLGGSLVMRGYVPGQYRDRQVTSGQAELRVHVAGRLGMATWGGAAVACNLHCSARWADVLPSTGAGLRYDLVPAERMAVRADFGVGRGTHGLYFDFTEAF